MPASKKRKAVNTVQAHRRKRVNHLKTIIVAGAVILLFTSVILNFVLVFKVLHLENQIDKLYSEASVNVIQNSFYL